MKREWRPHPEECENCGGSSEIFTTETKPGWGIDGDPMRCVECKAKGHWTVCDVDDSYCNWDEDSFPIEKDEEEEEC